MSHIPSSAMPHAGPAHHDTPPVAKAARPGKNDQAGGFPLVAIAIGGAIALGAVAIAVPLLRSSDDKKPNSKPKAKGKRKAHG